MNPSESWTNAERVVFQKLMDRTKTVEHKSAFLGDLPAGLIQVWAFNSGGGRADNTWGGCFSGLILNATIDGRFKTRASGQAFAMDVLAELKATTNMKHIQNIQWFRLASNGMPQVTPDVFVPANQRVPNAARCWMLHIDCELIFNLEAEYAAGE